ncbi:EMY162 protein [Echinococcus multilocularis]|uniref:EMY162 protein n=1 Tax=Echinococcus multilocularis TaxID=6211 RepID=A0A068Y0N7_ECHMU|nr:EMY162 protein [Echinococcus multilocularis]
MKIAPQFYLILLATSIFAEGISEGSEPKAKLTKELQTTLPEHFRWIHVGSRSLELGWDATGLANLHADHIKLTANFYSTYFAYTYKSVPIRRQKLTLEGLKPSTFYEVVVQALKGDSEVYKYTGFIRTLAPGEDGADRAGGFALIFAMAGLLLLT